VERVAGLGHSGDIRHVSGALAEVFLCAGRLVKSDLAPTEAVDGGDNEPTPTVGEGLDPARVAFFEHQYVSNSGAANLPHDVRRFADSNEIGD
jgi:hypothetical protein